MQEAIAQFIQYAEEKFDQAGQITAYKELLTDIAYGTWQFKRDFNDWRDTQQRSSLSSSLSAMTVTREEGGTMRAEEVSS